MKNILPNAAYLILLLTLALSACHRKATPSDAPNLLEECAIANKQADTIKYFENHGMPDSTIIYSNKCLSFLKDFLNEDTSSPVRKYVYNLGILNVSNDLGRAYYSKENYMEAANNFTQAIKCMDNGKTVAPKTELYNDELNVAACYYRYAMNNSTTPDNKSNALISAKNYILACCNGLDSLQFEKKNATMKHDYFFAQLILKQAGDTTLEHMYIEKCNQLGPNDTVREIIVSNGVQMLVTAVNGVEIKREPVKK
jgi:hypothetical protein